MKTKGMGIALLSAAALLGGAAAQAELPWNYIEGGYTKAPGTENFDTTAWDIKASIGFASKWHASLQYQDGSTDVNSGSDLDFDGYRLVVGAHPQLTPNTQLLTDLTYFNYDFDGGEGADGFGVGLGLRHGLTDKLELTAEAWYTQSSVDNSFGGGSTDVYDTAVEVGGRYNWTPEFSTGLTVNIGGGVGGGGLSSFSGNVARFDVRWSFLGAASDSANVSDSY
ncbi:MAG: outer membrane beta-barrel protein [Gammaproteobacteria bacterium]